MQKIQKYVIISLKLAVCICFFTGCSASGKELVRTNTVVQERYIPADPGAVEFVWEPPIVDVIDVPPGLDPEGHYYRPAHQAVVEIKQGKWQYYREGR